MNASECHSGFSVRRSPRQTVSGRRGNRPFTALDDRIDVTSPLPEHRTTTAGPLSVPRPTWCGHVPRWVRRALDCADLCDAAERVLSRGPAADARVVAAAVEAAVVACEASAAACGAHADHHDHCRLHSASAQAAADALRALQKTLGC